MMESIWKTVRHGSPTRGAVRLTWGDVPALMLAVVSAATVTAGARLLRGQNEALMLALGGGIAGATFVMEKLIVERLNAISPRQNLLALLGCWLPLFLFATALATVATFAWIAPEIARRDLEQSKREYWAREGAKVSDYRLGLTAAIRRQLETVQVDLEQERQRAADARRDLTPYSPDRQRYLQRRLRALRDLERRSGALPSLPLDMPSEAAVARERLDTAARGLADAQATALLLVPDAPRLPSYEPFNPPSDDLQSVLAEETQKRTWRAMAAWGSALWVELLPVLALWRGGRKVPLAIRIAQWRSRTTDVFNAALGRHAPTPVPIVIEPLKVRGVVRIAWPSEYTVNDCAPLLEEAIGTLAGILGRYQLSGLANSRGDALDQHRPLLPQLNGEPLVISVVEGNQ